ncbi:MAG: hypothetical protein DMD99_03225 [Candidatus Rokuibacteriota bacterium]|nr:MAG: hypothetical protein DMD99_03225 [Candidatus Rokubacteria bacterium]
MIQSVKRIILVAGVLILTACAAYRVKEQRTTQGPMAEDVFINTVIMANGREPNFDERRHWNNQIDLKISQYLHRNQDSANSLDVSTFRFVRQVSVGQTAEQVLILLGPPTAKTTDEAEMEKLARKYWPSIKGNATEAWVYPAGWNLYFKDATVVDITQYLVP